MQDIQQKRRRALASQQWSSFGGIVAASKPAIQTAELVEFHAAPRFGVGFFAATVTQDTNNLTPLERGRCAVNMRSSDVSQRPHTCLDSTTGRRRAARSIARRDMPGGTVRDGEKTEAKALKPKPTKASEERLWEEENKKSRKGRE